MSGFLATVLQRRSQLFSLLLLLCFQMLHPIMLMLKNLSKNICGEFTLQSMEGEVVEKSLLIDIYLLTCYCHKQIIDNPFNLFVFIKVSRCVC